MPGLTAESLCREREMSEYREFLQVEGDQSYDIGFHPAWHKLRMNVTEDQYYDGHANIEVYLTPDRARELAIALLVAADSLASEKVCEGENRN